MTTSSEYVFGANIIENLTTGMYKDSRVIYREYIQNACDSIDGAERTGILGIGEGSIEILLDARARSIEIRDNGLGVKAEDFKVVLGNIADSGKELGVDKGFRGIGRLAGLAYCSKLHFISKAKGESVESTLVCDAMRMRELLNENNLGEKHTASEVLEQIYSFTEKPVCDGADTDSHYFKVVLEDVNKENSDLLDSARIRDYLAFVAPIPYQSTFLFRAKVHNHAEEVGYPIDEYKIFLDGEQLFKKYTCDIRDRGGNRDDEIHDVEFHDFYDEAGELVAWMWFGASNFKGVIDKKNNPMSCLRLRKENIQIGDESTLDQFHREERGNRYFIGEVFAISRDLIPDSQRDYFNENGRRVSLERMLKAYFETSLYDLYRLGSDANAARKKIVKAEQDKGDFRKKDDEQAFISQEEREEATDKLSKSKKEAVKAKEKLEKLQSKNADDRIKAELIDRIQKDAEKGLSEAKKAHRKGKDTKNKPKEGKLAPRAAGPKYSSFTRSERKLVTTIYEVIRLEAPKDADRLVRAIEDKICE